MMHAQRSRPAVDVKRGAVAPSEERETGRMLTKKRYIALLTRGSIVVANVIKMNVDVVFLGSRAHSLFTFACR